VLAEAAEFLKNDCVVIFVGGTERDIRSFADKNKKRKNILIVGKKPHSEMPLYLKAADVVVLPNSSKANISKYYTSPIKLFEYMASGVPVVASRLPSLMEILNKRNALLVDPDNPKRLADGLHFIMENPEFGQKIARQALSEVQRYTWQKRAERVMHFVKNL
jgi:glycosyltransferase involved in cell wall biosynthesis